METGFRLVVGEYEQIKFVLLESMESLTNSNTKTWIVLVSLSLNPNCLTLRKLFITSQAKRSDMPQIAS